MKRIVLDWMLSYFNPYPTKKNSPYHGIHPIVFKISSPPADGIVLCNNRDNFETKKCNRNCSTPISAPTHGAVPTLKPAVNASTAVAPLEGVPTAVLPTTPMAEPIASSTTHAVAPGAPAPMSGSSGHYNRTLYCPERFTFGKYCYYNVHDDD
jgi:hypothetical protein